MLVIDVSQVPMSDSHALNDGDGGGVAVQELDPAILMYHLHQYYIHTSTVIHSHAYTSYLYLFFHGDKYEYTEINNKDWPENRDVCKLKTRGK